MASLKNIPIRGSIERFGAYLGRTSISAEKFIEYQPDVPLGLLQALGFSHNSVALPSEDPISFLKNATIDLISAVDTKILQEIELVEVGTESIRDGSLPASNYVVDLLPHENLVSTESKHACVATMNAVWRNCRDVGILCSTDIAKYNQDETTASSAEFTAGAGAITMLTLPGTRGRLLDILDVHGASSGLIHDFYKPYTIEDNKIITRVGPTVFGKFSNLANLDRVGQAYEDLKERLNKQGVEVNLDDFSGIVMHTPYPGLVKYNIAMLHIIDKCLEDDDMQICYEDIRRLLKEAHIAFNKRDFKETAKIEKEVKSILKTVIGSEDFVEVATKLQPSLYHISRVGNIYTGSSPLCMMSLLENKMFDKDEFILWGGYGSGNQSLMMIARTKETTNEVASQMNTAEKLDARRPVSAEEYNLINHLSKHSTDYVTLKDHDHGIDQSLLRPDNAFYRHTTDKFKITRYEKVLTVENQKSS